MKIRYFSDTDTVLIEFSEAPIAETREMNENLYIDFDSKGNLVSITLEHAEKQTDLSEVSFFGMAKT